MKLFRLDLDPNGWSRTQSRLINGQLRHYSIVNLNVFAYWQKNSWTRFLAFLVFLSSYFQDVGGELSIFFQNVHRKNTNEDLMTLSHPFFLTLSISLSLILSHSHHLTISLTHAFTHLHDAFSLTHLHIHSHFLNLMLAHLLLSLTYLCTHALTLIFTETQTHSLS